MWGSNSFGGCWRDDASGDDDDDDDDWCTSQVIIGIMGI